MAGGSLADLKLSVVCRLQRAADDRPARAAHPDPFVLCPAVHVPALAMLLEAGGKGVEEMAQFARIGYRSETAEGPQSLSFNEESCSVFVRVEANSFC
jgi:hypothetical protein